MCWRCRNERHPSGSSLKWIIMMKHPEEGSHWKEDIPWSVPLPPLAPALLAARHNPGSGTDRLTNKVNKYFPPLLKANQILILEVWSAEIKKQQTIGRRELIRLIRSPSLNTWGCVQEEQEEEEEEEAEGGLNCRNSFQNENRQIFGYARLKQFQFLIRLLLVTLVTKKFSTRAHTYTHTSS